MSDFCHGKGSNTNFFSSFCRPVFIILLVGLAIRLILAPLFTYPFDVEHWAVVMQNIESGNNLYSLTGYFYTPVWGYLLGAQDLLLNCFLSITYGARFTDLAGVEALTFIYHTSTVTMIEYNFVMKFPLICVDVLVGYLIYSLVFSETGDEHKSTIAFGCWFLCPLVIYMSSVQAQFDCISALLALLCIILLKKNYFFGAGVFFALCVLLKFFLLFCIPILCIYSFRSRSTLRGGIKQLMLMFLGILLTVIVIYLPLVLSGSVLDSLSFIFDRSSNNSLYTSLRLWVPACLLAFTVFALTLRIRKMSDSDMNGNLTEYVLTILCVATLCSSGPQYCIVYLPLVFMFASSHSRRDLLKCALIFTILATLAAFINNNLSLLSSLVEYAGIWNAEGLIEAMQLLETPVFGYDLRICLSVLFEVPQMVFNLILILFLFSNIGLLDGRKRLGSISNRLSMILGGETVEEK